MPRRTMSLGGGQNRGVCLICHIHLAPFAARWDGGRRYTGASTTMVEGNQSKRQSSVRNAMQKTITTILQAINGYRLRVAANAAESIKQKKAPFPGAEGRGRQRNA
jgi:hypothetical protein